MDFLPLLLGIVISGIFSGRWMAHEGSRIPLASGCLISALGLFGTRMVISPTVSFPTLALMLGISGIGFGLLVAPLNATAIWSLPEKDSGVAASSVNTGREFGAVAGVAILGSMVNGQLTNHLMSRLIQLGIPASFRSIVITAITTGNFNSQAQAATKGASIDVKMLINKVVSAAYGALSHGLFLALTAAGILLLIASAVAIGLIPSGNLAQVRLAPSDGVDNQ